MTRFERKATFASSSEDRADPRRASFIRVEPSSLPHRIRTDPPPPIRPVRSVPVVHLPALIICILCAPSEPICLPHWLAHPNRLPKRAIFVVCRHHSIARLCPVRKCSGRFRGYRLAQGVVFVFSSTLLALASGASSLSADFRMTFVGCVHLDTCLSSPFRAASGLSSSVPEAPMGASGTWLCVSTLRRRRIQTFCDWRGADVATRNASTGRPGKATSPPVASPPLAGSVRRWDADLPRAADPAR